MDRELVTKEGINLIKKTAFCHDSNPELYMSWDRYDPDLGLVYFRTFWVDHEKNGKMLKTVGVIYKALSNCILKEFKNILDDKKFIEYDKLFNSCEISRKYLYTTSEHGIQRNYIKFDEVKSLSDYHEFNKEKIEDIILENLKRKYKDFILSTTNDFIYFINGFLGYGLYNTEIANIIDAKVKFKEDFNERVTVGIIPLNVKLKKIDFINSVEDIPTQESKGYDIETGGLDDIFEIKTNIYR